MTKDDRNERVHKWLFPASGQEGGDVFPDGTPVHEGWGDVGPTDYCSKEGFWLLLEGLEKKKWLWTVQNVDCAEYGQEHEAQLRHVNGSVLFKMMALTATEALVEATLKVIDAEDKDGK